MHASEGEAVSICRFVESIHSMKVVTRRTGLSPHLIRVWERRYGAVSPARTNGNRRLYSDAEIHRLLMLREATRAGHSISSIAKLSEADLQALLTHERAANGDRVPEPNGHLLPPSDFVGAALVHIKGLDAQALEHVLSLAAAHFGQLGLLRKVVVPLIHRVGEAWREGSLKVAQEHVASTVIRNFLGSFARSYEPPAGAPGLLVTTPSGHLHELGAILVAVAASNQGWRVTYLGPSLPAEEIAGAAIQQKTRAVALSLVYPEDDPNLGAELTRLRRLLPPEVGILVGGRAAPAYQGLLESISAIRLDDLAGLQAALDDLRTRKFSAEHPHRPAGMHTAGPQPGL